MRPSRKSWKLQDAKARFSQLVEDSLTKGPQYVTRHGKNTVVVVSVEEFEELVSAKPSFKEFLLSIPKLSDQRVFERTKDVPRSVDL